MLVLSLIKHIQVLWLFQVRKKVNQEIGSFDCIKRFQPNHSLVVTDLEIVGILFLLDLR